MSIDFIRPEVDELRPRISVIGVGGAGGNAIANMMRADVQGVDFVVANTDAQALNNSAADRRIQLGLKITQGLGAGSRPEIGETLYLVPRHVCPTVNNFDEAVIVERNTVVNVEPVTARGHEAPLSVWSFRLPIRSAL